MNLRTSSLAANSASVCWKQGAFGAITHSVPLAAGTNITVTPAFVVLVFLFLLLLLLALLLSLLVLLRLHPAWNRLGMVPVTAHVTAPMILPSEAPPSDRTGSLQLALRVVPPYLGANTVNNGCVELAKDLKSACNAGLKLLLSLILRRQKTITCPPVVTVRGY